MSRRSNVLDRLENDLDNVTIFNGLDKTGSKKVFVVSKEKSSIGKNIRTAIKNFMTKEPNSLMPQKS